MEIMTDAFKWERPTTRKNGYILQGEFLVPAAEATFEAYRPDAALFRTFADVDPTPAGVLAFANRFGRLGVRDETLADWQMHVAGIRKRVRLADGLGAGNETTLKKALQDLGLLPPRLTLNDLIEAAVATIGRELFRILRFEGQWNANKKSVELHFSHSTLVEFMVFQLAFSVLEGRRFQQCPGCGQWFQLAPGRNRADRTTCSASCRFKMYRLRRRRASKLRAEGWTIKAIANEIGSDQVLVKQWLSNSKG